jgi:hypothetical protein
VILGSEERHPLMNKDIPLLLGLLAAVLKTPRARCRGFSRE